MIQMTPLAFIYYQFLSKTGITQKAKPVQGASPKKLHTTYKLHIHTRPQLQKRNIHTIKI